EAPAAEPVAEVDPGAILDAATGEVIDPAVAAAAVAAAEAELAISDSGEMVDPAAGLAVAEPIDLEAVEPVDAPVVSEAEVESLTELLTLDPTSVNAEALVAAAALAAPAAEGETAAPAPLDPETSADVVSAVTETIAAETVRTRPRNSPPPRWPCPKARKAASPTSKRRAS
ncbi:MAG: hypothetical protein HC783_19200, partial [Rhodobacteraceae bacterium]|nr:hypothetical protein [Paracoccaceae bacterium]